MTIEELVQGVKDKDQAKITSLHTMTSQRAMYIARSFTHDEQVAEDILQESYIKAFESIDTLKDAGKFQSWLNMIVTNKCKDWLKQKKSVLFSDLSTATSEGEIEFDVEDTSTTFNPDASVDYAETKRLVGEMIDSLPDDQRTSMIMFYMEDMSVKDIASMMECSENTIKSRLNYGRKAIKEKVLDLEKKGTKLYCFPLLPFLYWLFRQDIWNSISTTTTVGAGASAAVAAADAAGSSGTAATISTAASTGAKAAGISVATKAVIAVSIVGCIGIGAGAGVALYHNNATNPVETITSVAVAEKSTSEPLFTEEKNTEKKPIILSEEQQVFLQTVYDMGTEYTYEKASFIYDHRDIIAEIYDANGECFYDGSTAKDQAEGFGVKILPDDKIKVGNYSDGKAEGECLSMSCFDYRWYAYSGPISNNKINGYGTYIAGPNMNTEGPFCIEYRSNYIDGRADGECAIIISYLDGQDDVTYNIMTDHGDVVIDDRWISEDDYWKIESSDTDDFFFRFEFDNPSVDVYKYVD